MDEFNPNYPKNPHAADPEDFPPRKPPSPVPAPDSPEIAAQKKYDQEKIDEINRRHMFETAKNVVIVTAFIGALVFAGWAAAGAMGVKAVGTAVVIGVVGTGSAQAAPAATAKPEPTPEPEVQGQVGDDTPTVDSSNGSGTDGTGGYSDPGITYVDPGTGGTDGSGTAGGSSGSTTTTNNGTTTHCDETGCTTSGSGSGTGSDTGGMNGCDHPDGCGSGDSTTGGSTTGGDTGGTGGGTSGGGSGSGSGSG